MRLQHYITEAEKEIYIMKINELRDLLKKDCGQYIKWLMGRKPLFRGIKTKGNYDVGIKTVRQDRDPRLMNKTTLKFINEYLKERKLPLRTNSVMCTSSESSIRKFGGQRCFIYPIGKWKFAMVRSSDMNFTNTNHTWNPGQVSAKIEDYHMYYHDTDEDNKEEIYKYLDKSIDGNSRHVFEEAYNNEYEMWFDCKKYYYVDLNSEFSGVYVKF